MRPSCGAAVRAAGSGQPTRVETDHSRADPDAHVEHDGEQRLGRRGRGRVPEHGEHLPVSRSARIHQNPQDRARGRGRSPWLRLWAPRSLSYWMALGYVVGSALFVLGAATAAFRGLGLLADTVYFVGAQLFVVAVYVHLLSVLNGDDPGPHGARLRRFAWVGWRPRSVSFLVAAFFLAGAVLFSVETTVVFGESLSWWTTSHVAGPASLVGSVLFVAGGACQVREACGRWFCLRPQGIGWWSALLVGVGCVAFLVGSVAGLNVPGLSSFGEPTVVHLAFLTGSALFLVGSYLIIPETFSR